MYERQGDESELNDPLTTRKCFENNFLSWSEESQRKKCRPKRLERLHRREIRFLQIKTSVGNQHQGDGQKINLIMVL